MTRVRTVARARAALAALGVVLLTLTAAGAIVLVTGQSALAVGEVTIDRPQAGGVFTQSMTFSGTGNPGDTVKLAEGGGNQLASTCTSGVVVQGDGSWSCPWSFAQAGTTTVTATQTGGAPSSISVNLDVALPLVPNTTSPGRYATAMTTAAAISGSGAAPGYTVNGTFVGPGSYTCSGVAGSGGTWTCQSASVVPPGEYTFQATEGVGDDTATSSPIVYRSQPGSPASSPVFTAPYDQAGGAHDVKTITALTTTMSGTWIVGGQPETHATVEVDFGDSTASPSNYIANAFGGTFCVTTTTLTGAWSCSGPSTAFHFGRLYGISIFGKDEAGQVGPSPDGQFGISTVIPAPVPSQTTIYSNTPNIELIGTGAAGAAIHGTVEGRSETCDATVSSGSYECDLTLVSPVDGDYTVDLTQTADAQTSPLAHVTVVIDTVAPGAPSFSTPWGQDDSGPARAVVTTENPTFTGFADSRATVTVWASADPNGYPADVIPDGPLCAAVAGSDGDWSCTTVSPGLAVGSYSVGATQRDPAGNFGPSVTADFELYVDAVPSAPSVATPLAGSASQLRTGDTVRFSGGASSGTRVKVFEGGTLLCQSVTVAGGWSCSIASLRDGDHTVSAIATDSLGTASAAASRSFTVLPKAIGKSPLTFTIGVTDAEGNPIDGSTLTPGESIVLWSTGLPPDSTVTATLHSNPYDLGSATVGSDGTFKLKTRIPADVEPGDHEFAVTVTPPGDDPTTITSHTSVAPAPAAPTDAATPQPEAAGAGAPPVGSRPNDGFDAPSTFATTLPTFGSFPVTPTTVAVTGGIAVAFLLLVAFPSELLEDTIRENYDRAFGWLAPVRRRVDHVRGRVGGMLRNPWAGIALSVVATAVILGFADPAFGFTGASVRLLLGLLISVAVINIGVNLLVLRLAKQSYHVTGALRSLPGALLLVAISVLVSRLAHISPGFLFGLVLAVVYARELEVAQRAKLVILGTAITIGAGILAWLGYSALLGLHGSGFWYELGLEALVAITLEAVGTLIITMLPLTFLDGRMVFRWNRWAWAGIYLLTVAVFVVIVMPISNNWGAMSAPIFGWGTLFVVFAIVAFGTWAVFRFLVRAATPSSPAVGAEQPPPQPRSRRR